MSSDFAASMAMTVAASAVVAGASLSVFQTDAMSRKFLSPERLQAKRRAEYKYRWDKALQKAMFMQRRTYNFFNNDYELLTDDKEIQELINKVLEKTPSAFDLIRKKTSFDVVAIEHDHEDPRALQEYYLFLVVNTKLKFQVSLVNFGLALADFMEKELTSTALCFIADASSGRGTDILATLARESQAGVAVVEEPLWMSFLADTANRNVISKSKMERILFGFCRLEAVKADVGSARTVVFTLPGQACTPILLPLLQAAFPCERHVFCYSGCVAAVKHGLALNRSKKKALIAPRVLASTPVMKAPRVRGLPKALSKLPLYQADTIEAWMTSVDMFLSLKEQEKENNYLPFVLKLSNLLEGSLDDEKSPRRLALINVLQFITGSRSRPLSEGVVDAAVESLKDLSAQDEADKQTVQTKEIENCVFLHKSILIENKTLVDTVKPSKEWTLKSAKRISGCLCCAPEEEDEEEEVTAVNNMSVPGAFATISSGVANKRPKYVDGKTAFAFDPTKF